MSFHPELRSGKEHHQKIPLAVLRERVLGPRGFSGTRSANALPPRECPMTAHRELATHSLNVAEEDFCAREKKRRGLWARAVQAVRCSRLSQWKSEFQVSPLHF